MPTLARRRAAGTSVPSAPATLLSHTAAAFVSSPTAGVTTSPISTVGASLLVIARGWYHGAGVDEPAPTDSKGNTWVPLTSYPAAIYAVRFYYTSSPVTDAAHTFTLPVPAGATYAALAVAAFSQTPPGVSSEIDIGAVGSLNTLQPGSATPAHDGELIVTALCSNPASAVSIDSGFTITDQLPHGTNNVGLALAYFDQTTAAAINPTWTIPSSALQASAAMASFQ